MSPTRTQKVQTKRKSGVRPSRAQQATTTRQAFSFQAAGFSNAAAPGTGALPRRTQLTPEPFSIFHRLSLCIAALSFALLISCAPAIAAPLRIATWNLREPATSATNDASLKDAEARIQEAAVSLGRLDPDVIILQQVRDWQMCQQVVQALQPAVYSVQVCSAFRDAHTGAAGRQQIAILSRRKAYFSWSEPWRAEGQAIPGGFTFAAMRVGKQRVGLFAVELGDSAVAAGTNGADSKIAQARSACLQQWMREVGSFRQWVTNRIEAVVVAGGLNEEGSSPHSAEEVEFAKTLLAAPLQTPTVLPSEAAPGERTNYVFARLNPDADSLTGVILDRWPATCDVELSPAKQTAIVIARREAPPAKPEPAQAPQASSTSRPADTKAASEIVKSTGGTLAIPIPAVQTGSAVAPHVNSWWYAGLTTGIFVIVLTVWTLGRRKPIEQPRSQTLIALSTDTSESHRPADTLVITTQSVTGSAAEAMPARPLIHIEGETEQWRRRALAAEERANKNAAAMRRGLMPQMRRWLKEKLTRKLIADRAELLETQQAAALKAMAVDERLSRIELQIQQQNFAYERRIEELTRELAAAKEENRALIRAKIAQVKAEMEAARLKVMQQANG